MLSGTEKFDVTWSGSTNQLEAGDVRFSVTEVFKGKIKQQSEIVIKVSSMRGTSCGDYGLKRDQTYLVYAYKWDKDSDSLSTGVCTRTGQVDSNEVKNEDLKFLRNLPPAGTGGSLRGRIWVDVKKLRGGSADPLSGVSVTVTGPAGKRIITTDGEGKFELSGLKAGTYVVEPQLPQIYFTDKKGSEVKISDLGTADVAFEVYFNAHVAGRLVDSNGVEYNSALLHLRSINSPEERSIYGHSKGTGGVFTFEGVPEGEYLIYLELNDDDRNVEKKYYYPGTFDEAAAKSLRVSIGKKIEGLTFTLPSEFQIRRIEGRVISKNGKPASNSDVLLLCAKSIVPDGFVIENMPTTVQTAKDGTFTIEAFANEIYWLAAHNLNGKSRVSSIPQRIDGKSNLKNLTLVLSESESSFSCEN